MENKDAGAMTAPTAQLERAAEMATKWWSGKLMRGDKEKFEAALQPRILAQLQTSGHSAQECDYDPFGMLLEAVRQAGTECRGFMFSARGILPQKHSLDVYPDRLVPKEGYGRWTDVIPVPAALPPTSSDPKVIDSNYSADGAKRG